MPYKHISVMTAEALHYLNCKPGKIYVDCTVGGAGHFMAIAEKILPDGFLIGIDQDIDAIKNTQKLIRNKSYESNVRLFHDNYINLPEILSYMRIDSVDGILLDLGLSLYQLEGSGRGFSFKKDEPLDMRMNVESDTTAADIINKMKQEELAKLFKKYGEERWARPIAKKIVMLRKHSPIRSSKQLAQIICETIPKRAQFSLKIHPATRVFMALRIAVNKELERLDEFMKSTAGLLNPKGRLCILSFHSLEDRIVKHRIKTLGQGCICPPDFPKCICGKKRVVRALTKKPLRPTAEEVTLNPMARSAKLRAVEKI